MKTINISKVNVTPKGIPEEVCCFKVDSEILEWVEENSLKHSTHPKGYLNIELPKDYYEVEKLFDKPKHTSYFDGFSPNLNKELHIGHMSNLVYASAISSLGSFTTVVILNDTDNHPEKEFFEEEYNKFCSEEYFNYSVIDKFYASEITFESDKAFISEDINYKGCLVYEFPNSGLKVLKKASGDTSYIYQDLGLAQKLNSGDCTYLTGSEQSSHFEMIKEVYPKVNHLPMGLVTLGRKKLSSRLGNVVYLKDILKEKSIYEIKDSILKYKVNTFKENLSIKPGLSTNLNSKLYLKSSYENSKLNVIELISRQTLNPSFMYNSLKGESLHDINLGLKNLGY